MTEMTKRADIVTYGPDNTPLLVVEVKNRLGASERWAARLLRNLVVHGMVLETPYYLLVLPDVFYLWKNPSSSPATGSEEIEPDYKIGAAEVLAPYAEREDGSLGDVSEQGLEFLVTAWLTDLVNSDLSEEEVAPALRWLFESGLYEAIKNGSVAAEVAV